ncbi:cis-3-hydroxy-L-proline dehydratase [Rhizobium alvei]|uniref:Aconitase family protein n=1 Tax=Rhizobium alvei TaxID=1132659 RepID=A0ABT8YQE8_9HYPH|nr:aconitase family protein [Rhizobium alvei]MDO6965861.1 aconitase family protein [Rhizobium alvei]
MTDGKGGEGEADLYGNALVKGEVSGQVLFSDTGLSFWGGIDPETGNVIDRGHPLFGKCIAGRILAIPAGRGSCTGSSVLLQLMINGVAPAAMIFSTREEILTLGVFVAEEMFGPTLPVVQLAPEMFARLAEVDRATVSDGRVLCGAGSVGVDRPHHPDTAPKPLLLSTEDLALLDDGSPEATRTAMRIIIRMAELLGAERLIPVSRAHIDGCIYTGPASLDFAEKLVAAGGRVAVPTTLNAISVDRMAWQRQGTDPALSRAAAALADAYLALGARTSFTCAPYLREDSPASGDDIAWAESNAVVYANSVLGARTMKYPDFLDALIALTGRAPLAGCHIAENRRAKLIIEVQPPQGFDDSFWPLLGYHIGSLAPTKIPAVTGLADLDPKTDDLKAFGAAFATTSGAPMFHLVGITPEATSLKDATGQVEGLPVLTISGADLRGSWQKLQSTDETAIDLVALGNPHFSLTEIADLARLVAGRTRAPLTRMTITTSRATLDRAISAGHAATLQSFGAEFVVDACWCTVLEPIVPPEATTILTNSGKYAHYGPGLTGKALRFASLATCVDAACRGQVDARLPGWLVGYP